MLLKDNSLSLEKDSMHGDGPQGQRYLKLETVFVLLFLLSVCITLGHFIHSSYYFYSQTHGIPTFGSPPVLYAPEAYRVAIPAVGRSLVHAFHVSDSSVVATVLDVSFAFLALFLFYRLTVDDLPSSLSRAGRALAVALFLAFLYFPVTWIVPWQRPETLPTAFYLACALTLLFRKERRTLWSVLLLAMTIWQAFVRADVPLIFGIALMVGSLLKNSLADFGPRSINLARGAAVALIAASVQLYLQFVRFPHLRYPPDTAVIQLRYNLTPHGLGGLVLALLPVMLLVVMLALKRVPLSAVDTLAILASALYLPLWMTVGIVGEIRLFVPFLLALSTVAAKLGSSIVMDAIAVES
jgi:hypothetical protein